MSDPASIDAQLDELRNAVLAWRFPLLLVGAVGGLFVLFVLGVSALGLIGALTGGRANRGGFVVQLVLVVGLYGVMFMPVQLLFRAGVAGIQARGEPSQVLQMARLHEQAWMWMLGILVVSFILFVLAFGAFVVL